MCSRWVWCLHPPSLTKESSFPVSKKKLLAIKKNHGWSFPFRSRCCDPCQSVEDGVVQTTKENLSMCSVFFASILLVVVPKWSFVELDYSEEWLISWVFCLLVQILNSCPGLWIVAFFLLAWYWSMAVDIELPNHSRVLFSWPCTINFPTEVSQVRCIFPLSIQSLFVNYDTSLHFESFP